MTTSATVGGFIDWLAAFQMIYTSDYLEASFIRRVWLLYNPAT